LRYLLMTISALAVAPATAMPPLPVYGVAGARASLVGKWQGMLEYRDYSTNTWVGLPVTTTIEDQGDDATTIRRSDFDDGPATGIVRITSVELFDSAKSTVAVGTFRKRRAVELMTYAVRLANRPLDTTHWTMIEETRGRDDNRPAMLRLTTVRNGDSLETLKEVDFLDDKKTEWMKRNRTRLTLVK
jgi:hypothetical protein